MEIDDSAYDDLDSLDVQDQAHFILEDEHLACVEAISQWPMLALGSRPADWVAHDLLTNNLLRDFRLDHFQRMVAEPEEWMLDRLKPVDNSPRGIQIAALHFHHLLQLLHVRDEPDETQPYGPPGSLLDRLWRCRPYGAFYQERSRAKSRVCGMIHLCPWCRARAGVRLWQQLMPYLLDKELCLVRFFTTSALMAGYESDYDLQLLLLGAHQARADPRLCLPPNLHRPVGQARRLEWMFQNLSSVPSQPDDPFGPLIRAQLEDARRQLTSYLTFWRRRLGIKEGMMSFSVEPSLWRSPHSGDFFPQYKFVGFLLAEWPDIAHDPGLYRFLTQNGESMGKKTYVILSRGPLRKLLTWALSWPAVMLFSREQWCGYWESTRGLALYRTLGTWREYLRLPEKPQLVGPFPPRQHALDVHNAARATGARRRREELLEIARPLWRRVLAEPQRGDRRGRPPHRQRLSDLLAAEGIAVTRRQLSGLMAALRAMTSECQDEHQVGGRSATR